MNTYFPEPSSVSASMFYHFESNNDFAIRCINDGLTISLGAMIEIWSSWNMSWLWWFSIDKAKRRKR
jgi:hypothetical protein